MESLIEYIAKSLVNDPTQVDITLDQRGRDIRVQLNVAEEDMGRVIGRNGRVANAMRSLLRVAASRQGLRATLDIR